MDLVISYLFLILESVFGQNDKIKNPHLFTIGSNSRICLSKIVEKNGISDVEERRILEMQKIHSWKHFDRPNCLYAPKHESVSLIVGDVCGDVYCVALKI